MKRIIATLCLAVVTFVSVPSVFAAKETVAGTMKECLAAQAEAQAQFARTLSDLQKASKSSQRDHRLVETFRKRLAKQKKVTPELQVLLDAEAAWQTTIGDKLTAYFGSKADLLESFCSTDPAKVLSLLIAQKTAEVAIDQVMVDYYSWIGANYEQFKKLFPAFYQRKIQKWFKVDKATIQTELDQLKLDLDQLKKEPAVFQ